MQTADRAEAECIRRFKQLSELARAVDEAARRAEVLIRLDMALRRPISPPVPVMRASRAV